MSGEKQCRHGTAWSSQEGRTAQVVAKGREGHQVSPEVLHPQEEWESALPVLLRLIIDQNLPRKALVIVQVVLGPSARTLPFCALLSTVLALQACSTVQAVMTVSGAVTLMAVIRALLTTKQSFESSPAVIPEAASACELAEGVHFAGWPTAMILCSLRWEENWHSWKPMQQSAEGLMKLSQQCKKAQDLKLPSVS